MRWEADENGCWIWLGHVNACGYGTSRGRLAHRVQYEELVGPIPDGMELDHLCRVRSCVNPDHLEPVTHLVNHRRSAVGILTEEDVLDIRRSDATTPELAALYGVAEVTISQAKSGISWRDVPMPPDAKPAHKPRTRPQFCIRGHEFTPENTRIEERGKRKCRACCAIRARERRARLAEARRAA